MAIQKTHRQRRRECHQTGGELGSRIAAGSREGCQIGLLASHRRGSTVCVTVTCGQDTPITPSRVEPGCSHAGHEAGPLAKWQDSVRMLVIESEREARYKSKRREQKDNITKSQASSRGWAPASRHVRPCLLPVAARTPRATASRNPGNATEQAP